MTTTIKSALLALSLAACGDNSNRADPPDGGATPDAPAVAPRAIVVSGDFITPGPTGVMSALDLESMEVMERVAPNGAIGNDPTIRKFGDELYVVNRSDGNNVTILDARTFALKEQLATGAGSNPQDVAVLGGKLYIPAFGTAGVVVATRGMTETTTIDLSELDPDGQPNCISAFEAGGSIYVACELLDENFSARGPGKIAVIDPSTDTMITTITMANENPFGVFEKLPDALGGDLMIPTVQFGDFSAGCVERIRTGATPASNGCLVTNQVLGGFATRIDFQMLGTVPMVWMIVSNGEFGAGARQQLYGYDLEASLLWPDPITPPEQLLVDATVCPDGSVVVADQTTAANGLRVYEGGIEKTTSPLAIGIKPGSSRGLVCY